MFRNLLLVLRLLACLFSISFSAVCCFSRFGFVVAVVVFSYRLFWWIFIVSPPVYFFFYPISTFGNAFAFHKISVATLHLHVVFYSLIECVCESNRE